MSPAILNIYGNQHAALPIRRYHAKMVYTSAKVASAQGNSSDVSYCGHDTVTEEQATHGPVK